MTLPFLKHEKESGSASSDPDEPMDMLDAVAEDIAMAMSKTDKEQRKSLLKDALSALVDHIQNLDQKQDAEEPGK